LTGLVLAVFGPTASGKTAVAEEIARRIAATLVSADSMQVYEGLPILTAQPSTPTELVAIWPLSAEGSVGAYQEIAHEAIDSALAQERTPVVVGGTGLYLRAALADLRLPPKAPNDLRERLSAEYDRGGAESTHVRLADSRKTRPAPRFLYACKACIGPGQERRGVRRRASRHVVHDGR